MEGTLEAFGTSVVLSRRKLVLCQKIEMCVWKARIGVSWSYYLKGRRKGGPKEDSGD